MKIQLTSVQRCSNLVTIRQRSFICVINYWALDLHTVTACLISSFTVEFTWAKPLCRSECLTFSVCIRSPTQIYTRIHTQKWYSLLPPTQTRLSDSTAAYKAQKKHACKHKSPQPFLSPKINLMSWLMLSITQSAVEWKWKHNCHHRSNTHWK